MGGGGGGTTTNVTNTGLGDDQYQSLYDNQTTIQTNQGNIADSLDAQRDEAATAYNTMFGRMDNQDTAMGNISNAIGNQGYTYDFSNFGGNPTMNDSLAALKMATGLQDTDLSYDVNGDGVVNDADAQAMMSMQVGITPENTQSTGLYAQFDQQNQNLTDQFGNVTTQFGDLNRLIGNNQIQTDQNITALGDGMSTRFDTLDQANTNLQSTVDTGFADQAQGFNDLEAGMNDQFDAANTAMGQGFTDQKDALDAGIEGLTEGQQNVQANVLEGQGGLQANLDTLSGNMDTYASTSLENQEALQQGQDTFKTSFDNYVDRYSDDVTLANQTRADMATAQANAADRLREDLGAYAQATATGQTNLSDQLGNVAEGVGQGLMDVGASIEGGFSDQSTAAQQAQENLTTRLGGLRDQLQTTGDNLDANSKAQFESLANSFDANGQLIQNSIAANGDTIKRQMDDQGNIVEQRFDQTGQLVGQNALNINDVLTASENMGANLSGQVTQLGNDLSANLTQQTDGLMSGIEATGEKIQQGARDNRTATEQQINAAMAQMGADTQQMFNNAEATATDQYNNLANTMAGGFQNMDVNAINQAKDLAAIAATQGDLDMGMRQNFNQLAQAFDDNGQLIANSVDEQGNTLSRAIDNNGNLLLRSFDVTGNEIGNKVININRSLNDLGNLQRVTGANQSMGNLSPASQGAVPTGGFMSPFTITQ